MDHILEGVLASSHPDPMKRQLIDKIAEKGRDQQQISDIHAVLNLSINWILQGNSELQVGAQLVTTSSFIDCHSSIIIY
jgi:hypothetical protein